MVYGNGIFRIFWPYDAIKTSRPGVIVGWRNSATDLVVVAVLEDVETRNVEHALRVGHLFRNSAHPVSRLFELCGHESMYVLGNTNEPLPESFDLNNLSVYTRSGSLPYVFCPRKLELCFQVVIYRKPSSHKLQYLSLTPISLALGDKDQLEPVDEKTVYLIEKMKLHSVIQRTTSTKELIIPKIIDQINCSQELTNLMYKNVHLLGTRRKRTMSVSERVVESANSMYDFALSWLLSIWTIWIWPISTKAIKTGIIVHRVVAEIILRFVEWRPSNDASALKDISATAQQLDIRLQQFCYWPIQWLKLQSKRNDWESITDSHPDYIRFFNSLWLVANDMIIGLGLGAFLIDNAEYVASFIDWMLCEWTIIGLRSMIEWLTDWPAGLKLNTELASFLADLVLWVINYWSYLFMAVRPILPQIIYFIGFSSFAGATLPIAMFSDLLDLSTMHINGCYIASARIFHWQLTIIVSLFHLFRGKKNNVLRNRIDSCEYDLDQLLLGTILFTLLVFLLPTVVVFYLTFACSRMAIITLSALLETALAFLNHFPLFAIMLRIKDSKRLPGGIAFETQINPNPRITQDWDLIPQTSFIIVKSVPLTLRQIFDQYFQLSARLRRHYLAPSVLFCLLTGQFVPPIHRKSLYSLQYSMLPAQRIEIGEIWKQLNTKEPAKEQMPLKLNGTIKIANGTNISTRRANRKQAPP